MGEGGGGCVHDELMITFGLKVSSELKSVWGASELDIIALKWNFVDFLGLAFLLLGLDSLLLDCVDEDLNFPRGAWLVGGFAIFYWKICV